MLSALIAEMHYPSSLLLKASNFMSMPFYIVPIKLPTLLNRFHLQVLAL